jgi:hypothetical protein
METYGGEVEEMFGRCEAMSQRALTLQQDADEWFKHAMWDKELEHKLSQLQVSSPSFTNPHVCPCIFTYLDDVC